jgi:hypothetical protein
LLHTLSSAPRIETIEVRSYFFDYKEIAMCPKTKFSVTEVESLAFSLEHVVGVSDGLSAEGDEIIRIMINCPVDQFQLPNTLIACDIVLEYVGDMRAQ